MASGKKYSTFNRRIVHSPAGQVQSYPRPLAKKTVPSEDELRAVMTEPGKDGTSEGCMCCDYHFEPGELFFYGTKGKKLHRVCNSCKNARQIDRVHMIGQIRPKLWDMPTVGDA